MNYRIVIFILLAIGIAVTSCRKTEDDPLSIRSRKNRVTGKWKVTGGMIEQNSNLTNDATILFRYTLYESSAGIYYSGSSATHYGFGSDNVRYSEQYEFTKGGEFMHNMRLDSDTWEEKGQWNFTGGVGARKSNTELLLMYNESITSYYGKETWDGEVNSFIYDILELRNDKMVLEMKWKYYDSVQMEFLYYTEYKVLEKRE